MHSNNIIVEKVLGHANGICKIRSEISVYFSFTTSRSNVKKAQTNRLGPRRMIRQREQQVLLYHIRIFE